MLKNKVLLLIWSEIKNAPCVLKCAYYQKIKKRDDFILIKGFILKHNGKMLNYNWGDDINIYFLEKAIQKEIIHYPDTALSRILSLHSYMCIGSIVASYDMKNTVIWGSGLINDKKGLTIKNKPKKILAVRGPLTRNWLLERGVDCPEIYGDPALLLPKYYSPKVNNNSKIGIIPHYKDLKKKSVIDLLASSETQLIKIQGYKKWTDFIDQICSCDMVVSSSLHGLIIAEAYGIPSVWAKFSEDTYEEGWEFKYHDFYHSINKPSCNYILVDENTSVSMLRQNVSTWKQGQIDLAPLQRVCPFEMRDFA